MSRSVRMLLTVAATATLGLPAAARSSGAWEGYWQAFGGHITFKQSGSSLTGTYTFGPGVVDGSVTAVDAKTGTQKASGTWHTDDGTNGGSWEATLSADRRSFSGRFKHPADASYEACGSCPFSGTRVGDPPPPDATCTGGAGRRAHIAAAGPPMCKVADWGQLYTAGDVAPGGQVLVSSAPLSPTATTASATVENFTENDFLMVAKLVRARQNGADLRAVCYAVFIQRFLVAHYRRDANDDMVLSDERIESSVAALAGCVAVADKIDEYLGQHPARRAAARAAASGCPVTPVGVHITRRAGRSRARVTDPPKGSPLRVTCTQSAGSSTVTVQSRTGSPLRKIIGSRLSVGLQRSRQDPTDAPSPTLYFEER